MFFKRFNKKYYFVSILLNKNYKIFHNFDITLYQYKFLFFKKIIYKSFCFDNFYWYLINNKIDFNNIYFYNFNFTDLFGFLIDESSLNSNIHTNRI